MVVVDEDVSGVYIHGRVSSNGVPEPIEYEETTQVTKEITRPYRIQPTKVILDLP